MAASREERCNILRMMLDAKHVTQQPEPVCTPQHVTYVETLDLWTMFGRRGSRQRGNPKQEERRWLLKVMAKSAEWHDVVGVPPINRYDVEYQIGMRERGRLPHYRNARELGLPRIDAVAYHEDGSHSLIEAKVDTDPIAILQGVAQLLYYKTMLQMCEGITANHLILAAPAWPPFVVPTITEHKLPIRLLKMNDEAFVGAIPSR